MGLDVYLRAEEQQEATVAQSKAWDDWYAKYHDADGNERPEFSAEEREAAHKEIPDYPSRDDPASRQYPDHYFNRRYLRSSYNDSGFNRAVPDMTGKDHDLYWIFGPVIGDDPEPYETRLTKDSITALKKAKKRALQVADEIRKSDPLRTMDANCFIGSRDHQWHEPPTEREVLDWYREERAKRIEEANSPFGESYSNAKGLILGFNQGLEVLAVTVGKDILGGPAAILVYRMGDEGKESYVQSAEITAEFCDEAIDLISRDGSCTMVWSG